MDFAVIIAPLVEKDFIDRYWDRAPVHIPASPERRDAPPMGWNDLNALIAQRTHWTPERFNLVLNSRPVDPAHYMADAIGKPAAGDPARIEHLLAMGASLVVNHVDDVLPRVRAIADTLATRFAGLGGANVYASFNGVQAFASHYDTHEVFAFQCAGEKRWRIYANRAESPLEAPQGDDAQAWIDASKGPVLLDITTRPGDLLYIPRGFFHDAIATDTSSLHVTFGVAPHSGRILLELIEEAALTDPAFRAYLPDARVGNGVPLRERLAELGQRLAEMAASPVLADAVALRQRKLSQTAHSLSLPDRPTLRFFARTGRQARIERDARGIALHAAGHSQSLGLVADAAEWMLARAAFSREETYAQFAWHPRSELDAIIDLFERLGLIAPYQPQI
ncbi:JmjC domain-containing protein [Sphingomonas koreensis]|uniref:JmjC domain-containing protein n=1 Tax=Sphingomonas koreensis TaxID=93064 RepID=A0A1L6JC97_9SPHN|nr:cupin domain-containing protein [Sphingomonas koreensis]APR53538.1 hypothetical protein BRX40_14885 [Sphingomonas koreensis]MDC7809745.1 cupin domain-containing protein [Sphingomonas koreensis]